MVCGNERLMSCVDANMKSRSSVWSNCITRGCVKSPPNMALSEEEEQLEETQLEQLDELEDETQLEQLDELLLELELEFDILEDDIEFEE